MKLEQVLASAPLVEEDNVLKLSTELGSGIGSLRGKVSKAEALKKFKAMKLAAIEKAKEVGYAQGLEQASLLKQSKDQALFEQATNFDDGLRLKAIMQNSRDYETVGVSGSGLTADGRSPYPDRPNIDWDMVKKAPVAFGGMGDILDTMKTTATPIAGEYSTYHQFLINLWKSNQFSVKYKQKTVKRDAAGVILKDEKNQLIYVDDPGAPVQSLAVDGKVKKKLWDMAETSMGEALTEFSKSASRGWMWSGYHENGEWVQVKVPFVYGLPMDIPEGPNTDTFRNLQQRWRSSYYFSMGYDFKVFDSLKDVIKAYALYFQYVRGGKGLEEVFLEYEKTGNAKASADGAAKGWFAKLFGGAAVGAGDFNHPMIQKGHIPKRGV